MEFSPEVQEAIISGAIKLGCALVAFFVAMFVRKERAKRKRAEQKLLIAFGDIAYMMAVETAHVKRRQDAKLSGLRDATRRQVERETGLTWSGKFVPSRTRAAITAAKLNARTESGVESEFEAD